METVGYRVTNQPPWGGPTLKLRIWFLYYPDDEKTEMNPV